MLWKHCMKTENYSFSSLKCTGSGQVECLQIYKVLNFIHARDLNRRQSEKKKLEDSFFPLQIVQKASRSRARPSKQKKSLNFFEFISVLNWISICFMIERRISFQFFSSDDGGRHTWKKYCIRREVDISAELNKSSEAHSQNTAKKKKTELRDKSPSKIDEYFDRDASFLSSQCLHPAHTPATTKQVFQLFNLDDIASALKSDSRSCYRFQQSFFGCFSVLIINFISHSPSRVFASSAAHTRSLFSLAISACLLNIIHRLLTAHRLRGMSQALSAECRAHVGIGQHTQLCCFF